MLCNITSLSAMSVFEFGQRPNKLPIPKLNIITSALFCHVTVHVDLAVQNIWSTLNINLSDIEITPRLIYKILAMANDSDDWDADSIQAKLLALQLSFEPERSPAHEWDGDAINTRLEALLQATSVFPNKTSSAILGHAKQSTCNPLLKSITIHWCPSSSSWVTE